jgi:hypothetical protein
MFMFYRLHPTVALVYKYPSFCKSIAHLFGLLGGNSGLQNGKMAKPRSVNEAKS